MKIVKTVLTVIAISLATAASAATDVVYEAADNTVESKLCVAAATVSKLRMNSKINHYFSGRILNGKYAMIANEVVCNGESIADFAAQAGNYQLAEKLASYQRKNVNIQDIAKRVDGKVQIKEV